MPIYNFKNMDTEEIIEISLSISQMDQYRVDHPHMQLIHLSAPKIARDSGSKKPDSGFRDVLKSIKKASGKNNTINTF